MKEGNIIFKLTPESSQVERISYDKELKRLDVKFKSGKSYAYYKVPLEIWEGINAAKSVGTYLNKEIKGKFNYSEL